MSPEQRLVCRGSALRRSRLVSALIKPESMRRALSSSCQVRLDQLSIFTAVDRTSFGEGYGYGSRAPCRSMQRHVHILFGQCRTFQSVPFLERVDAGTPPAGNLSLGIEKCTVLKRALPIMVTGQEARRLENGRLNLDSIDQDALPRFWLAEEHERFEEVFRQEGPNDWARIAEHVGTRTVQQVRTHAQKHMVRLRREALGLIKPQRRHGHLKASALAKVSMCKSASRTEQVMKDDTLSQVSCGHSVSMHKPLSCPTQPPVSSRDRPNRLAFTSRAVNERQPDRHSSVPPSTLFVDLPGDTLEMSLMTSSGSQSRSGSGSGIEISTRAPARNSLPVPANAIVGSSSPPALFIEELEGRNGGGYWDTSCLDVSAAASDTVYDSHYEQNLVSILNIFGDESMRGGTGALHDRRGRASEASVSEHTARQGNAVHR
ncbi:Protein LHY [Porphyridium purpureum]|uniref:Protein LHY n=1 Tax=Porphyridium purpureum TaxID=35688 RepID=A0A5J4ZAA3_PORPP|nr:Protein LHY [Porphyridium purpureum]|eukprot:POR4771..scf295_1